MKKLSLLKISGCTYTPVGCTGGFQDVCLKCQVQVDEDEECKNDEDVEIPVGIIPSRFACWIIDSE